MSQVLLLLWKVWLLSVGMQWAPVSPHSTTSTTSTMGKDLVDLTFYRGSADEPWGFRLAGGKDYGQPLTISQVIIIFSTDNKFCYGISL